MIIITIINIKINNIKFIEVIKDNCKSYTIVTIADLYKKIIKLIIFLLLCYYFSKLPILFLSWLKN